MKIVMNCCYGGFELSDKALAILNVDNERELERDNKELIDVIEKLGQESWTRYSELRIFEIPDEVTDWDIFEYDGMETLVYVLDGKLKKI